jgi:PKD repeat protein
MNGLQVLVRTAIGLGCVGILLVSQLFRPSSSTIAAETHHKLSKRDRIDLAMAQEFEKTQDPALGAVPRERLLESYAYTTRVAGNPSSRDGISGVRWTELGPLNVGGRTRAILVDPLDSTGHTVWAASVSGGLWKTTDITAADPNWQNVDDFFANLAITCLAVDPNRPQVRYFGTGEGYFNSDAVKGMGIWKSIDGGQSWQQLSSTQQPYFEYCQKIVITSSGTLLVATRAGLYRSVDGGQRWTKVLGGSGVLDLIYDIELAANGDLYASAYGSVHKSTNDGLSFSTLGPFPISMGRIELACAPSDSSALYLLAEFGSEVSGILHSRDGGVSWQQCNEPNDLDPGIPANDFARGQAWYNLSIAVDPNCPDCLYVGGIDLFKSTDGGSNWQQVSHWYGSFGLPYVHADQHFIAFAPGSSDIMYFGNDGGVYRTTNGSSSRPSILSKEINYRTLQLYSCAMHPHGNSFHLLGGTQDNGSQRYGINGLNNTFEVTGGDGGFCHIDQDEPQFQFTSYVYNYFRRSTNGGQTFQSVNHSSTGRFINPSDYDDDANIMYSGHSSGSFLRWDNPQTGSSFNVFNMNFGGRVSAVTCDPNAPHRVYFGIDNGRIYQVEHAHTTRPTATRINLSSGMPYGYISCIEVQKGNPGHLLVTYSNYGINSVWETRNGGQTWHSVEGNLPDMPIRWAIFSPNDPDQALLATELGVWSTDNLNASTTVWEPSTEGLANVRVDMLQTRSSDKLVIAATHGRGMFYSDAFSGLKAAFSADREISYLGEPVSFTSQSSQAADWYWDFGDSTFSTQENPSHAYSQPGKYTVKLLINQGADSVTQTDYIHILPNRGSNYGLLEGGNLEVNPHDFVAENRVGSGWERGISSVPGKQGTSSGSVAWVTDLANPYSDNSESYLYTPEFDLRQVSSYVFRFKGRFSTEAGYDGFRVEYTVDRGSSWQNLGTVSPAWYNFTNNNFASSFPYGEPFFTGNFSNSFATFFYDVSSLSGNSQVGFRFVFKTDGSVTSAGVAIDDVALDGVAFPVELIDFDGEWRGALAHLYWKTATEQQNEGFVVERSTDGNLFSTIGFVDGKGNTSQGHSYSFDDLNPGPALVNFYRLKQVDLDGSFTYLPTIELRRSDLPSRVRIYPNPVVDFLYLQSMREGEVMIRNLRGQVVKTGTLQAGENRLNLQELQSGMYLLTVMENSEVIFGEKILKK